MRVTIPVTHLWMRVTIGFDSISTEQKYLADDKLYKAEYLGSGTFNISKPKRSKTKRRQSNLKNAKRGSRK